MIGPSDQQLNQLMHASSRLGYNSSCADVDTLLQLVLQVLEDAATADPTAPGAKGDSFVGSLEDAVLHNANQFHKWHTELEAACASETEEKYKQYAQLLQNHLASCDKLQGQVRVG